MKIAVISDIKSNIYALKAVLESIKKNKAEVVINLGDSFLGNIAPRETYDLIRESSFINLCGNEDRYILEASVFQLESDKTLKYAYENLGEDVLYWIQDLPFEKLIGEDFYMVHGTYFNDQDSLLEEKPDAKSNGKIRLRQEEEILKLTDNIKSKFIFCANTSQPRCINLSTGQVVISGGSVHNDTLNEASYVILDIEDGEFEVKLKKVPYQI